MDWNALVRAAVERLEAGDDEGFVACFDAAVKIYCEPELSGAPVVNSQDELAAWLKGARGRLAGASLTVTNVELHGDGIVADAIVVSPTERDEDAWRVALAIRIAGDAITEVRPFWQRETAMGSLVTSG
jgi:hypothetical protein